MTEPFIHTVYDLIRYDFPAKNAVRRIIWFWPYLALSRRMDSESRKQKLREVNICRKEKVSLCISDDAFY